MENNKDSNETGLQTSEPTAVVTTTIIDSSATSLNEILMDNIKRIQENPNYIPQAQAVADQVGKIIDVAKIQVEAARVGAILKRGK